MTTPPKRWPNNMIFARDGAAEAIQQGMKALHPLLQHEDPIVVARAARSLYQSSCALRFLESAGASTRPISVEQTGGN